LLCKRGHPLKGENLRPGYGSWRICNLCHCLAAKKARRRVKLTSATSEGQ
jgi:hypothetical protein